MVGQVVVAITYNDAGSMDNKNLITRQGKFEVCRFLVSKTEAKTSCVYAFR